MNLYCIARVIEVFASLYVDCNIMKKVPLSMMVNSYLVSAYSHRATNCIIGTVDFSVNHRKEDACITHIAVDSLHKSIFSCFCFLTGEELFLFTSSHYLFGVEAEGVQAWFVISLPGWCHPLTTEKQKQGQIYICEVQQGVGEPQLTGLYLQPSCNETGHRPARLFLHCSRTHTSYSYALHIVKILHYGVDDL